jgi:glycerol-3-phosphate acyltransferase PlsY
MPTALPAYPVLIGVVLVGYLLGSIPFGVIATRLGGAGDIRKVGSGNIGATNVLRTGRRDLAAITLVGDGGKGAVAALLAHALAGRVGAADDALLLSALAGGSAFFGHLFPVWLRFKGGKGMATFFGVMLVVAWPVGLMSGATWIAVAVLFRFSSLSALAAAALAPFYALAIHAGGPVVVLATAMAAAIFIRHRENIARLIKGEEPRIGAHKAAPPTAA